MKQLNLIKLLNARPDGDEGGEDEKIKPHDTDVDAPATPSGG